MTLVSVACFALCGVALLIASRRIRRQDAEATSAELFDRLLRDRSVRFAVIVIWWWLGWHFLAGATL